jgi:hypothetical protein
VKPDPVPDPGFLRPKIYKKNTAEEKFSFFFDQRLQFAYPFLSKLQENHLALKREHPALQKMKLISFFLFMWVIANPDPDPGTPLNPDPQHWYS